MNINWNTNHIDLQNLIDISRNDQQKILKYLHQFQELIPPRIEKLKAGMQAENRLLVRQILHQVSPQLHFFGVPGVVEPIRRLELEYEAMPIEDLRLLVKDVVVKLQRAIEEVDLVLEKIIFN
ncbi:MAG: HPt (histidine-containing phosphotransfer) domain-containing protein [Neolewinella sp.]|jgi:HPt (histidine-containing phosphotransfer) domain-containing protein